MNKIVSIATMLSLFTAVAQAQNANVTWQAPVNVSGASDVNTQGLYYGSWAPYDGNANNLPVNGVTFQGNSDLAGLNANFPNGDQNGYNGFNNPGTPNSNYNTLLQTATYCGTGNGTIVVTWNDIPGHTYLIQLWANDGRGIFPGRSETVTGGSNTSGNLDFGDAPGQYVVGTYVADSSGSQTITVAGTTGSSSPMVNLLQVRDITEPAITWSAPASISGASDVNTQGTYFGSWAPYSSSSLTVNGVTFQNSSDLPNFSNAGFNAGYNAFPNPGTADNNYNTLLQAGAYEYPGPACTFTWGGMAPGHTYLVQLWVNGNDPSRTETFSGGSSNSASINYDPGQYITGTFVANGASETITLLGNPGDNYPQINLVQVRDLSPASTFSNYQSAVINDAPVGYWPLNLSEDTSSTANDYSGNGNSGTYFNITGANLVAGPAPYITNAVSFSGAEVDLSTGPNPTSLDFTGPTTLEAWVQPSQTSAGLAASSGPLGDIIAKGYDPNNNYQEIALRENNSPGPDYYGYFGTGGVSGGSGTNWVYLVIANVGNYDYLYINGVLVQTNSDTRGSIPFVNSTLTWAIGNGTSGGNGRTFNGNICQVAMYNYGLSASQVLKHFYAAELNAAPTNAAPIIVTQPQAQGTYVGGSVTFSVTAVSGLPMTNQWYDGNTALPGQTNATLTLNNLQLAGAGNYKVVVGNARGTTNSVAVALTVAVPHHLEWSINNNSGTWDVGTTFDWLNVSNSAQSVFSQGDQVLFDDTPGVPTSVSVSGTASPSLLIVNSTNNNFSIGSGTINGSGSLLKEGPSTLTISSSAGLGGTATVGGGTFSAGNNCLSAISSIVVSNGATLDLAGGSFSSLKPVSVSGNGASGQGALYNSYDDYPSELVNITMTGNTLISGAFRWDLAGGSQVNGAHTLTMDWAPDGDGHYAQWNSVSIGNVLGITVTNSNPGSVTTALGLTGMDSSFQNPATVVNVCSNAQLVFYGGGINGSIHLQSGATIYHYTAPAGFYGSTLVMEGGSTFQSYYNSGQTTPVNSAVTLNGIVHFVVGDHYMVYSNVISGVGGFVLDYYNNAMSFSAANTYSGPTIIGSSGNSPIVALTGNGSISHSPLIFFGGNSPSTSHIDVSGRSDDTLTLASGQTLQGVGEINGNLVVSGGATVSPGGTNTTIGITTGSNPVGAIVASGNVTLAGSTIIKLDGATNDVVVAVTNIVYGGTLNLANISGSPLAAGNSFQIFSAAQYSGSFSSIVPASAGGGLVWDTSQLASSGIVNVVAGTSTPVIQSTAVSSGNIVFSGIDGMPNANYVVYSTTNLTTPNWIPVATNSFDGSGNFTVTAAFNASTPQVFYRIR
jgi:hypothetical protein